MRIRFHSLVYSVFAGLTLVIGLVMGSYWYLQFGRLIHTSADQALAQLARQVKFTIVSSKAQMSSSVRMVAASGLSQATNTADRLAYLPLLQASLAGTPLIAMQIGYQNGDYFIVRRLGDSHEAGSPDSSGDSEALRQRFNAPAGAVLMADSIEMTQSGERVLQRLFYDVQLQLLARQQLADSGYDPRRRPWYSAGSQREAVFFTAPYHFFFVGQTGITAAIQSSDGQAVIAADLTLQGVSETLAASPLFPSAKVVLFDRSRQLIAWRDLAPSPVPSQLQPRAKQPEPPVLREQAGPGSDHNGLLSLEQIPIAEVAAIAGQMQPEAVSRRLGVDGEQWYYHSQPLQRQAGEPFWLAMLVSEAELMAEAGAIRLRALGIGGLLLLLSLPLAWLLANRVAVPLQRLLSEVRRVREFDFTAAPPPSSVSEIRELSQALGAMKNTISQFMVLITSLAGERDFTRLLKNINHGILEASDVDAVAVLLAELPEGGVARLRCDEMYTGERVIRFPLRLSQAASTHPSQRSLFDALREQQITELRLDPKGPELAPLFAALGSDQLDVLVVPLADRSGEPEGLLCLFREAAAAQGITPEQHRRGVGFVKALSGFASVSIESQRLLAAQKALFESFVQVLAGAIDTKSGHTGGHCQRVPVLARLLAEAASESQDAPWREFVMSDDDREALHIAAWLHDCGKVTTPEFVVDKATRLETLYDRIHEVRMRFEVLKRDATVRYWQQLAAQPEPSSAQRQALQQQLAAELEQEHRRLDDEFAFVAECNSGEVSMTPERCQRLQAIAGRQWQRTLDDRAGISAEERKRRDRGDETGLPVNEPLLADKPEHAIPWPAADPGQLYREQGYTLQPPEYQYQRGELHNLMITHGTLSAEERFRINDHIVQSIRMLSQLNFPRHLADVPAIAGGHHEKMDGSGYPQGLRGEQMSVQARVMVLADIFEALTASDRPYKRGYTLSEALTILQRMSQQGHIDPALFELFLTSGSYLTYARQFLKPEQIDAVDISRYLA